MLCEKVYKIDFIQRQNVYVIWKDIQDWTVLLRDRRLNVCNVYMS